MSKQISANINCPQCQGEFSGSVYRSIWIENPKNRELIFSNKINTIVCPHCKAEEKLEFPFLCTNVDKQIAIWYEPYPDSQIDKDIAGYRSQMGENSFYAKAPRIKDWGEFKEKIIEMEKKTPQKENAVKMSSEMKSNMKGFLDHIETKTKKYPKSLLDHIENKTKTKKYPKSLKHLRSKGWRFVYTNKIQFLITKIKNRLTSARINSTTEFRIITALIVPLLTFLISFGIMSIIDDEFRYFDINPNRLDESWWAWTIVVMLIFRFELWWLKVPPKMKQVSNHNTTGKTKSISHENKFKYKRIVEHFDKTVLDSFERFKKQVIKRNKLETEGKLVLDDRFDMWSLLESSFFTNWYHVNFGLFSSAIRIHGNKVYDKTLLFQVFVHSIGKNINMLQDVSIAMTGNKADKENLYQTERQLFILMEKFSITYASSTDPSTRKKLDNFVNYIVEKVKLEKTEYDNLQELLEMNLNAFEDKLKI
jgi:hypothetical protein